MKTIGLIGGMSWESTLTYYQVMNSEVVKRLGGFHSAKILLYSVDFDELERNLTIQNWDGNAKILSEAAQSLERGGADCVLIGTNTMHNVYEKISSSVNIPVIHIAEATADALLDENIKKVALLGTKYTMLKDFYKNRLINRGIEVIIPDDPDIEIINDIIFNELCLGEIKDSSRKTYQDIIDKMKARGAEGIILGCTEIGLLIKPEDSSLPTFDTTIIHAKKAVDFSLNK